MQNKPSTMPVSRTQATSALVKPEPKDVTEYIPFAAKDPVKLSVSIVKRLIAVKTKTGHVCSDEDAIRFIAMCKARGLNPFEGDAFLIGYDSSDGPKFSLITAHQAFLKRAELHAEYEGMKSGVVVSPGFTCEACNGKRIILVPTNAPPLKCFVCDGAGVIDEIEGDIVPIDQELIGGWSVVHKKGKLPMHKRIPIGPYRKTFGVWKDNPSGMIVKCAEADGLRAAFPTTLGGLYLREEIDLFPDAPAASSAPPPTFLGPVDGDTTQPAQLAQPASMPVDAPNRHTQEASAIEQGSPQDASEQKTGSTPTPEPESQPEQAPANATGPQFMDMAPEIVDGLKKEGKLVATIAETLKLFGLTDGQLTQWARDGHQAKGNQTWRDLSETKLSVILTKWGNIGPIVKSTAAK